MIRREDIFNERMTYGFWRSGLLWLRGSLRLCLWGCLGLSSSLRGRCFCLRGGLGFCGSGLLWGGGLFHGRLLFLLLSRLLLGLWLDGSWLRLLLGEFGSTGASYERVRRVILDMGARHVPFG